MLWLKLSLWSSSSKLFGGIVCGSTLILGVSSLKGRDKTYSIVDNIGECSLPVRR
jgi:hypothetical protein